MCGCLRPTRHLAPVVALALLVQPAPPDARAQEDPRERARILIERADAAAAGGRAAEAVTLLEAAEREAPDWPELKVNLAAARSAAGDFAGAAAAARAALSLNPSLQGARFNLGLALLKSGDAEGAAATLAPYSEAPAPPAVHAALGLAWVQTGRVVEAAPVLQRSVDGGIRDRDTLLATGRAWLQAGKVDRARAAARLLEKVAGSWIHTRLLSGDAADAGQDWAGAADQYRAAAALQPDSVQARYSLGLVLYKQREYDESARELEGALQLDPSHVPSHYYLALLELDRANVTRAAELLERAATLAPERADVARDLGRARIHLEAFDRAAVSLRRAISLSPDDPTAWFLLGRALQRTGKTDESRAAFARAAELNQLVRERALLRVTGKK